MRSVRKRWFAGLRIPPTYDTRFTRSQHGSCRSGADAGSLEPDRDVAEEDSDQRLQDRGRAEDDSGRVQRAAAGASRRLHYRLTSAISAWIVSVR